MEVEEWVNNVHCPNYGMKMINADQYAMPQMVTRRCACYHDYHRLPAPMGQNTLTIHPFFCVPSIYVRGVVALFAMCRRYPG